MPYDIHYSMKKSTPNNSLPDTVIHIIRRRRGESSVGVDRDYWPINQLKCRGNCIQFVYG